MVMAAPASAASSVTAHNAAAMRLTDRMWTAVRSRGGAAPLPSALAGAVVSFTPATTVTLGA